MSLSCRVPGRRGWTSNLSVMPQSGQPIETAPDRGTLNAPLRLPDDSLKTFNFSFKVLIKPFHENLFRFFIDETSGEKVGKAVAKIRAVEDARC